METMQPYEQLETDFGKWAGVDNVVACSSGTAALHLALEALQLPPGSEVIVPDFCMIAVPRAVVMAGLVPAFVDCNDRLLLDSESLGMATVEPYQATVCVHIYGRREDMDWIHSVTTSHHAVIEDLAESHGINPHESTDAACWSFYKNKHIGGEEGGAVAFRDKRHADHARQLRSLGFTDKHDFHHIPRGHNYRLSNANASLILASLHLYRPNLMARRWIESCYEAECPVPWRMPRRDAPWVYDIRIPGLTGDRQDAIVAALNAAGIAARHAFKPMSEQLEFKACRVVGNGNAARLAREIIYLPLTPGQVTEEDVKRSFQIIHGAL